MAMALLLAVTNKAHPKYVVNTERVESTDQ